MTRDLPARIASFLATSPVGVVGASADPGKYGYRVLAALLESGREAIPVNPREQAILGEPCVPSVRDLPTGIAAISVITPPSVTESVVVPDAIAHGIRQIWMQPGAESTAAIEAAEAAGLEVIAGGPCLLVALDAAPTRDPGSPE